MHTSRRSQVQPTDQVMFCSMRWRGCSPDANKPKPVNRQPSSALPKRMAATGGAPHPTILDQQQTCTLTDRS